MAAEGYIPELTQAVSLLGAALVAVPLFRKLGLGSVLGYIVAGVVIGPFGLRLFNDPDAILHVAELGVVMFLFVIGLEMQPSKLWKLRGEIFGLGAAQVAACGALLTGAGVLLGLPPLVAFVGGMGWGSAAKPPPRTASAWCPFCCSKTWPSCRCWHWWRFWRPAVRKRPPLNASRKSFWPWAPSWRWW